MITRDLSIGIVVMMIVCFLFCSTPARAADELTVKVNTIEFKNDKNGKEYCAIRFDRKVETQHLKYEDAVLAIIPSWQADALKTAKTVKPGQTIIMAGNWNAYNGSDSFKVKAIGLTTATTAKK
jgi:hypothetical protein